MSALPGRLVLLGHPVAHSLSPAFQNAALRSAGLPLTYEAIDVPEGELHRLSVVLRFTAASGNVTVPYKEEFAKLCAGLTPIAQRVGAVNTFWTEGGELVGDNTDVGGFEEAVKAAFGRDRAFTRVAVIGAGGSAAAVLAAIERWPGAAAQIWTRTRGRAEVLAARFPCVTVADARVRAIEGAELVVNTTPLGLSADDEFPVPIQDLPARAAVFDLTYRRGGTRWVQAARGAGHPAADGIGMLLAQGALAFERWFGRVPDRDAMWAALDM
ncbi:MAG: shikimate dehydrogenase family protein [Gemmatimonadaceae bacterium]